MNDTQGEPTRRGYTSRAEREENIRHHSDSYGVRFCTENAPELGRAILAWRASDPTVAASISIRAYNRQDNKMYTATLNEVLDHVPLTDGQPQRLSPTQFGQVILTPTMYISTVIYVVLTAAWNLSRPASES